jgi:muconolactone delta-isomerase
MQYLVTMTTRVPEGTPDQAVADVRSREAARSGELAQAGHLLRLWRPPLQPGQWRTLGLFSASDAGQLEAVLASMPLRVWRTDEVTPLSPHPNDPGDRPLQHDPPGVVEFLTAFVISIPPGTAPGLVEEIDAREARRAHQLAEQGRLVRLWNRPGEGHALGLWRAAGAEELGLSVASLPLSAWMTVQTTPLTAHPNDPGLVTALSSAGTTSDDKQQSVAIITGGSRGIGAGIVAAYRRRGWAVATTARSMPAGNDPQILMIAGDLSLPETASRIVAEVLARFGRIDTLVNNAGVYVSKPFTEYSIEDYTTMIGVNLTGFFTLTQLSIEQMVAQGHGHVVNITSTLAEYADSATPAVLTALTKGGLASATKSLAIEYASRGIRVNAVSPGVIQTPPHAIETYRDPAARTPVGRVGQIGDVVDAVLFLEGSPFVTGEVVHIDGGRSAGH